MNLTKLHPKQKSSKICKLRRFWKEKYASDWRTIVTWRWERGAEYQRRKRRRDWWAEEERREIFATNLPLLIGDGSRIRLVLLQLKMATDWRRRREWRNGKFWFLSRPFFYWNWGMNYESVSSLWVDRANDTSTNNANNK